MSAETDFPSNGNAPRDLGDRFAWRSVQRGDYRWDLQSFTSPWLNDDGELPLTRWQADGQVSIIKTGPHRTVYHLKLPEGNFYLKHYRTADWQAILQNLVRPSKADLEWKAARKIAALNLPTFETVAIGRKMQFGFVRDNFLISREIPRVEPLDQFVLRDFPRMETLAQQSARRDMAEQLGYMTAILHRSGALHRDLHPGNVLVQNVDGRWNLYLIDLHATSWKRRLSLKQIAENLSLLNNFFARVSGKTDRLRFLKSYRQAWNNGQFPVTNLTPQTIKRIGEICERELAKADLRGDKKWKRGNRRLLILNGLTHHCRGLAELGTEQLQGFCNHPENLFEKPHLVAWQKRDASIQRGQMELDWNGTSQAAIVTAFRGRQLARQGWEMGHALIRRRLPAPRPFLFVETPATDWDYLVMEPIPQAMSLHRWLSESRQPSAPHKNRRQWQSLLRMVATELRRLHDLGFHQPKLDLHALLVQHDRSSFKIWFTRLESLQQVHRVDRSRVQQSMATLLHSSRLVFAVRVTDCLRFLRAYLNPESRQEWKSFWRDIARLIVTISRREAA